MFEISEDILNEYANLAVIVGTNVQAGQTLLISAPVEAYKLARKCSEVAYKAGAKEVIIDYNDGKKTLLDYTFMDKETLGHFPNWKVEKTKELIADDYCTLSIVGNDPDLLNGVDEDKIKSGHLARMKAMEPYRYYFTNSIGQWSIVAYPELNWAKKVFPDIKDDDKALNALWEAILKTSRVEINKTVSNWQKHNEELFIHCNKLNEYRFKSLHFKNKLGTDLIVGLIKDHIWQGGKEMASGKYKVDFNANIPTEEVFTMPDCHNINGVVFSTKPLSYNGKIIPSFNLTFKDGKVVDYDAKINKSVLESILDADEGSRSLGEVALISYNSPISNSNILFYDTLFDENASCHLALGACYPTTLKDGEKLSEDKLYQLGGNKSMNHVDFMFGSEDLEVVGEREDGEKIIVFENGNFVI